MFYSLRQKDQHKSTGGKVSRKAFNFPENFRGDQGGRGCSEKTEIKLQQSHRGNTFQRTRDCVRTKEAYFARSWG